MDVIGVTSDLILYVLLTAAVIGDFSHLKISNRLILTGLFISIPLQYMRGGLVQVFRSFPNIMFPVILLFIFYLSGILGAGDIKLFSLIGGYTSFRLLCACMVCSFAAGAVLSLVHMLYCREFFSGMKRGLLYLCGLLQGRWIRYPQISEKNRTHFSLAILIGVILTTGGGYFL